MPKPSNPEHRFSPLEWLAIWLVLSALVAFLIGLVASVPSPGALLERSWPRHMQDETLREIRDENAEIVAGLVAELADPDLHVKARRRKEAQLKAAEERLTWAEDYLRLGHDPDLATRRGVLGE